MATQKEYAFLSKWLFISLVKSAPVLGAVAGLIVGGIFVTLWGASPWQFVVELVQGAFGDPTKIGETLTRTTPILIAGVGTAIAFKAGSFNVGQEGQLHLGAIGAALVGFMVSGMAGVLALPLVFIGSMLAGMIFAGLAAWLRLKRGVHEVLSTLLLNFVGVFFLDFMISGPIRDTTGLSIGTPRTPLMPSSLYLPFWPDLGYSHLGIVIGVILAILAAYVLWRTPLGFQINMVGLSPEAARSAGYSPEKIFVLGMLICGALSGLAGGIEITGVYHRVIIGFGEGLGFDALAVTLLANSNPIGVIFSALFFGALRAGSMSMQRGIGVPSTVLYVIRGAIILCVLIGFAISNSRRVQKKLRAYEMEKAQVVE
jgi:general nucleoside transport system permease protein